MLHWLQWAPKYLLKKKTCLQYEHWNTVMESFGVNFIIAKNISHLGQGLIAWKPWGPPSLEVLKQDWKSLCQEWSRCVTNHASGQRGEINGLLNPSGKLGLRAWSHSFTLLPTSNVPVLQHRESLKKDTILGSLNDSCVGAHLLLWLNRGSTGKSASPQVQQGKTRAWWWLG